MDESPDSPTRDGTAGNEEYHFFAYPRFETLRRILENELESQLMLENLVNYKSNAEENAVVAAMKRIQQLLKEVKAERRH